MIRSDNGYNNGQIQMIFDSNGKLIQKYLIGKGYRGIHFCSFKIFSDFEITFIKTMYSETGDKSYLILFDAKTCEETIIYEFEEEVNKAYLSNDKSRLAFTDEKNNFNIVDLIKNEVISIESDVSMFKLISKSGKIAILYSKLYGF